MNSSNTFSQKKEKYYSFIYKNGYDLINIIFIGETNSNIEKICTKISKNLEIDSLTKKDNEMMINFLVKIILKI